MAKAEQWAARVAQWRESGQSARAFCADKDFNHKSLWAWSTKLNQRKRVSAPRADKTGPAFVRVASTSAANRDLRVLVAGAEVVVEVGFDRELLRDVVNALGASK